MHYQISRNGQEYGPYTLEDLQRYLASGNVLPTDLAKSETMTEWGPVSTLLPNPLSAGAPSYDSARPVNPPSGPDVHYTDVSGGGAASNYPGSAYRAPVPSGADPTQLAAQSFPDAPNLHWGLYLLFAVITCGLFSKVFTVIQAVWMRKVQPNSIALWVYIGAYVLTFINAYRSRGIFTALVTHHFDPAHVGGSGALGLLYWVLIIAARFLMKSSLEAHFNGPEPTGLRLSGAMTLLFGGVYFQAKLNETNEIKRAARYGTGAMRF